MVTFFISKQNVFRIAICIFASMVFLFPAQSAFPAEAIGDSLKLNDDIDAELKYLQEETYVITGSRIKQRLEKASFPVYVITDREIQQMGARFLTDLIPIVPGWHIWECKTGEHYITANRIGGFHSGEILVMVNSHPLHDAWSGGTLMQHNLISIDNASRIEFVTGPGSAVYGSGAFAGVINIITKEADDVDGLEVKAIGGSYNTRQANLLIGKSFSDLNITTNLNVYETDGFDGKIDADAQTTLDNMYGTNASMAPGKMKGEVEKWDAQFTLKYSGLTFDGKFTDSHREYPVGPFFSALDEESYWDNKNYYLNLSYETSLWEEALLLTKVYHNHYEFSVFSQVRPAGSVIMTPSGPFVLTEDTFVKPSYKNDRTGIESQLTYEVSNTHTMVAGAMYEEMKFYDANIEANFRPTGSGTIPLPEFQDFPEENNYDSSNQRNFKAIFWEDVWDARNDLRFNLGCRYDAYSDFGDAFSPRIGLNWQFMENFYLRTHYGRAFRAPTLEERYEPTWGSTDLNAVTVDTYELALGARFFPSLSGEFSYFFGEEKDGISMDTSTMKLKNIEEAKLEGITMKLKYDFGRQTYLAANYTYIEVDMSGSDESPWTTPEQMAALMANVRLNRYMNWNAHCLYRGEWTRQKEDSRGDMSDYTVVNTTLIARKFLKGFDGLELALTVNNLFDEDYSAPTSSAVNRNLPGDFPMPGRNFLFEVRYTY